MSLPRLNCGAALFSMVAEPRLATAAMRQTNRIRLKRCMMVVLDLAGGRYQNGE